MDQSPNRVELRASGWSTPIGLATGMNIRIVKGERELLWVRVDFDSVRLSRAAALLVVQGIQLQDLFPTDLYVAENRELNQQLVQFRDPILLKVTPPNPLEVSPTLRGVVLGLVVQAKGFSEEEVRGALVASVLQS